LRESHCEAIQVPVARANVEVLAVGRDRTLTSTTFPMLSANLAVDVDVDFVDTPAPPLIADVTPTQTQSFNPGWISVAGQGFTMTSSIEIDGEPMNPFFIKVFADGDLQFLPPLLAQAARLVVQPLDALALGGFSIGAVPVAASGFVFESQILTFDIHGVTGTSPIMSTTVFSFP
jgi:hypothetical protein